MDTSTPIEESFFETLEASSSSASSIHLEWNINSDNIQQVEGYRVHYQKVASKHIHYGPLLGASDTEYEIENLVADTYYKVCLLVIRNGSIPFRECVDASTTNWQLPVSVGSSIGAILALSMIVLIVLLSRCNMPLKYGGKKSKRSQKYDTISSNYPDDQYDFSETVTHGQDDDFTSDDDAYYEIQGAETRRSNKASYLSERPSLPNGISRSHVHPHSLYHNQHRNSLSRIPLTQPHHHHHHHSRQMRAYSMQAAGNISLFNQPCSPLAKEARKYILERGYSQQSADAFQEPLQATNAHINTGKDNVSPTKEGQPCAHKTCSPSLHAFNFIDETPDTVTKSSTTTTTKSKSTDSFKGFNKTDPTDSLLIKDIEFEDMSKYGASGGRPPFTRQKTLEMASTNNTSMFAVPESMSFEEHSV